MIIEQWTQCLQHTLYFLKTKLRFWRQNSNHLGERKNSFGDNFSRNLWDFYFVGEKSFLVTISRGQNELPRVGETTQEVSTGQFAWMAHSFVVYTEHNHHRHHRHHHNHHSFVVYLARGSHLIWKSIAMGWEINGMGNLTSLDKAPRLAFILIQYLSNSTKQQILGRQCYLT